MAGEGEEDVPRDAKIVKSLLKSMGVEDYEPRVVHQFLELWYRYVVEVLTDAQVYSEHASKSTIDCDDVKLAIQSKVSFSFSQPPPREVLLELAASRNKIPLPKSIAGPGIPLPPEQDTLLSPNYQLVIPKKSASTEPEETEDDEEMADPAQSSSQEQQTSELPTQTPQRVSFPLLWKNLAAISLSISPLLLQAKHLPPRLSGTIFVSGSCLTNRAITNMESSVSRSTSVVSKMSFLAVLVVFLISSSYITSTEAYDALDPEGNITMKWDVMSWTPDGYVAVVTMFNFQKYRHIPSPGWTLGWKWAKKEVIWSMVGAQTTEQGDCSKYKGNIPHCCKKDPTVVDLLPGTPYNQQIANCCKGGVLNSWVQDPGNAASSFQISVGAAGTTNKTVRVPRNFTLMGPGPGYTCGPAKVVRPTKFVTTDTRRTTQAMMTWNITCTYSQFLAQRTPTCCVSLSSFYNETIVGCPTCACGCQNNKTESGACLDPDTPHLASVVSPPTKKGTILPPLVQCTRHLCPIRVHWHVKQNYKEYWRVKITITNFNYRLNYSQWNMVAQHPNFDNITQIFSFNYKSITPYAGLNDTAMLWGVKFYNDFLSEAGPLGNVQSEILFRKDQATFSFEKGWAFPRRIYFNGDNCVMPPPDTYPFLPNGGFRPEVSVFASVLLPLLLLFFFSA